MKAGRAAAPAILGTLLAWIVFRFDDVAAILAPLAPGRHFYVERETLPVLAFQHFSLSAATCLASLAIALPLGILASREGSRTMRQLAEKTASFGQTFPMAALIALLVPAFGYGTAPVAFALTLFGILPILRNTLTGLRSTPPEIVDAALGCGMSETQISLRVRAPLAMPLILQGIRIGFVTNIGAATIGAAVGSGGLGVPIISGIRSFDTLLILKGSLPVAILALFVDSALRAIEERLAR